MSLRDELQTIYDQHGRLTPDVVVEAARPKSHPLHGRVFDRVPGEAAEAWYRHRAHELIQEVTVVYKRTADGRERVRYWHSVRTEAGYVFEPLPEVGANPLVAQMVLRDMEREWRQMKARYGHMREFLTLVQQSLEVAA